MKEECKQCKNCQTIRIQIEDESRRLEQNTTQGPCEECIAWVEENIK